jgi:hypothetical protein
MKTRWTSAHHCYKALESLSHHLNNQPEQLPPERSSTEPTNDPASWHNAPDHPQSASRMAEPRGPKRRRQQDHAFDDFYDQDTASERRVDTQPNWMPVLEYNGPDFGFDATQFTRQGALLDNFGDYSDPSAGGFFSGAGWDAFIQGLGSDGHFNN